MEGISKVEIESVCQIVNGMGKSTQPNTEYLSIIARCQNNCNTLPNFGVGFDSRQINRVAYCLARASQSFASPKFFNYIPNCIMTLYLNELMSLRLSKKKE